MNKGSLKGDMEPWHYEDASLQMKHGCVNFHQGNPLPVQRKEIKLTGSKNVSW